MREYASVIIASIVALASGVGTYTGSQVAIGRIDTQLVTYIEKVKEIDAYQAYLTSEQDKMKERIVRGEVKTEMLEKANNQMNNAIVEMSKDMKKMSESIQEFLIRSAKRNG